MRYLGGKTKIGKKIAEVINSYECRVYREPFVGGMGVTPHVTHRIKSLSDLEPNIIGLWRGLWFGTFDPPETVTEEQYHFAKNLPDGNPLKGFVGYGCSYAGKLFSGYARGEKGRNYASNAKNSCLKKIRKLRKTTGSGNPFWCVDYKRAMSICCPGDLVYCDPPYLGTTEYKARIDREEFIEDCLAAKKQSATVLVSEYEFPIGQVILKIPKRLGLRRKDTGQEVTEERLYLI